ncbi:hypothetical protein FEM48_Zijuj10G0177700 [Ziziphus jujuba var. spinosa]|uniref:Uncharacterized protein n=1 Tax=Ziziphus jujuba var. spinosa TaxID=714518 RepID=A0A978UPT9_ZIZJJ|nr:hypothetical protein FEM48_Zijuj10G0177700 [Ziziphus jujuba var. spinosa]
MGCGALPLVLANRFHDILRQDSFLVEFYIVHTSCEGVIYQSGLNRIRVYFLHNWLGVRVGGLVECGGRDRYRHRLRGHRGGGCPVLDLKKNGIAEHLYHANRMMSFYAPGWCGEIRDVIFSDNGSVTVVYRVTIRGSDGENEFGKGHLNIFPSLSFEAQLCDSEGFGLDSERDHKISKNDISVLGLLTDQQSFKVQILVITSVLGVTSMNLFPYHMLGTCMYGGLLGIGLMCFLIDLSDRTCKIGISHIKTVGLKAIGVSGTVNNHGGTSLTYVQLAHRESSGTISSTDGLIVDPVAAAEEIAFCKACARFGLGLYLYHEE